MTRASLELAPGLLGAAIAEAARLAPVEYLALLIGRQGDDRIEVVEILARPNAAARPESCFRLDPADWVRARRRAAARGLDIVGFAHAHPHGPARLSAADRAGLAATFPEQPSWPVLLLHGDLRGRWRGRAWRLRSGRPEELRLLAP